MAAKKQGSAKKKAQAKVGKVMHEFKHGELKSGGRAKVKNRKQAIAIGLSEARRAGGDVPPKKGASKKAGAKKSAANKSASKNSASKNSASTKSTAAKSAAKKGGVKKSGRKRG
ncbi:MAG: histone H1-like protein [Acidobacteriia bacterium]|nr:histone H1-like protein [Terriglobia bacterium]